MVGHFCCVIGSIGHYRQGEGTTTDLVVAFLVRLVSSRVVWGFVVMRRRVDVKNAALGPPPTGKICPPGTRVGASIMLMVLLSAD